MSTTLLNQNSETSNEHSVLEIPKPLLFYTKCEGYKYTGKVDNLDDISSKTQKLYFPLEADTEFYDLPYDINKPSREISKTLTIQHRAIPLETGIILTHPDSADIARHPIFESGFSPVDYLRLLGHDVTLERADYPIENLPILQIDLYGFFFVAELYRIVLGKFKDDFNELVIGRRENAVIEMNRRLIAQTSLKGGKTEQYTIMPWILTIDNHKYHVAISIFDTCAVHGNTNYATFCANSGVKLKFKDVFTPEEKSMMNVQYTTRPEDFDNYSLGDLYNYDALLGNIEKSKSIYKSVGLEKYFESPRLTIGATDARLVRSAMLNYFGLERKHKNQLIELCRYATSSWLKNNRNLTSVYLAKIDGGRCRNNRPYHLSVKKPIVDADINGCYGNGLKNQDYPFGRPIIIDYPIREKTNEYFTLSEFLKKHRKNLVPGLWQARVSTRKGYELKYAQDFLMSWIPPKDPSKILTDTELEGKNWWSEDNIGILKIFTNQINLAVITQEFLDWLENTASARQRKELLENLVVITAMFYPKKERCETIDEFFHKIKTHKGGHYCDAIIKEGASKVIRIDRTCNAWISVNMGDLLVSRLLEERGKYKKTDPEQKALNELYKLYINTLYGDMVSPYFDIGNVVVGNNITARARAMAWYMEKGLNGFQTITDGCAFELNRVIHKGKERLTSETVLKPDVRNADYKVRAIGDLITEIKTHETDEGLGLIISELGEDDVMLSNSEAKEWVAEQVSNHLKKLFPDVPVIDKFTFEIKDIYDGAAFHGTANYKFKKGSKCEPSKMRSYSKKRAIESYTLIADELQVLNTEYKPSEEFLESVLNNPASVPRSYPYIARKTLKPGEYKAHYYSRWEKSEAFPGCTVESGRMLKEFSLGQFTFQSIKQYQSWEREYKSLLDKYGQSYEMFFLNEDGTLDYQEMCQVIYTYISQGAKNFKSMQPANVSRHLSREYQEHERLAALEQIKHQLNIRYGFLPPDDSSDDEIAEEWSEFSDHLSEYEQD